MLIDKPPCLLLCHRRSGLGGSYSVWCGLGYKTGASTAKQTPGRHQAREVHTHLFALQMSAGASSQRPNTPHPYLLGWRGSDDSFERAAVSRHTALLCLLLRCAHLHSLPD